MNWNPWRTIAHQRERIAHLEGDMMRAAREVEGMRRHADLLADRYDKIRESNQQLRETLDMYRTNSRGC